LLKFGLQGSAESPPLIQLQEILDGNVGGTLQAGEVLRIPQWPVLFVERSKLGRYLVHSSLFVLINHVRIIARVGLL
jgi:hypothetical protein